MKKFYIDQFNGMNLGHNFKEYEIQDFNPYTDFQNDVTIEASKEQKRQLFQVFF